MRVSWLVQAVGLFIMGSSLVQFVAIHQTPLQLQWPVATSHIGMIIGAICYLAGRGPRTMHQSFGWRDAAKCLAMAAVASPFYYAIDQYHPDPWIVVSVCSTLSLLALAGLIAGAIWYEKRSERV